MRVGREKPTVYRSAKWYWEGYKKVIDIDLEACGNLLRATTDKVASISERPPPCEDLSAVIAWVRGIGHFGADELRAALYDLYPPIKWGGEEPQLESKDSTCWIHDPIDGAYHYIQNLPLWSSSLALVTGGKVRAAFVYEPALGEMFVAAAGYGATLNGHRLTSSMKTEIKTSVMSTAIPPLAQVGGQSHRHSLNLLRAVSSKAFVVRQMGSASLQLAYVASGRLDGYWEVGQDVGDWLAGSLLVEEAGGIVSDMVGQPLGWTPGGIVAAPSSLHRQLVRILAKSKA
ncbi:inositol monophosphatase family protein [Dyella aluminiiresistens]|uniref:inositol monophosphatase family protein n=1 Tax=Dyella aluminiiresistens TaxID=3069105 RepID=UPI00399C922E